MEDDRLGRYRLVRRIGAGGMAEVFRAELEGAEGVTRALVVKKIQHALSLDREAVEMFVQEARVAARLHHPNVVQVYEFGRAGDGYFLAMELVDGCDLAALVRGPERMPLGAVAWVFAELLEALGYVHAVTGSDGRALGLVHRDVSPHNVLLGAAGEVKLADFGIATAAARVRDEGVKGKYAYMAPEQARGEALDARADLYAVGAMLYEALSGRRLHPAGDDALSRARSGEHEPLDAVAPTLDPALVAVVSRALAAAPDERFPDARTFREALAEAFFVAGVTPARDALRALVRRALEARADATPAAERTLTAQADEEVLAPEPAPAAEPRSLLPAVSPRSRRILERVGIAVGVFTLAVLAERRTRPPGEAAVVLVVPDDAALRRWAEAEALPAAQRACRCVVAVRSYRDPAALRASLRAHPGALALVDSVDGPALRTEGLVRALPAELPRVEVRARLAEAFAALDAPDRWMLPVAFDPVVLSVRPEAAARLARPGAVNAEAFGAALSSHVGTGAPGGWSFERDPAYWTWWDLLAAAWTLRGPVAPLRLPAGGRIAYGVWAARRWSAASASAQPPGVDDDDSMIEPLGWEAISNALILASYEDGSASNDAPLELTTARAVTDGARAIHPMPRCDAWLLGPSREPRTRGGVARVGLALGWTLGAGANAPDAARALRSLTTADRLRGGAHAWRALPVTFGAPPSDPSLARTLAQVEALVASERAVVVTGHGDEAAAVAAVASLIRAARTDAGARFAGDGRWWIARMREAVAAARREAVPGRRL